MFVSLCYVMLLCYVVMLCYVTLCYVNNFLGHAGYFAASLQSVSYGQSLQCTFNLYTAVPRASMP